MNLVFVFTLCCGSTISSALRLPVNDQPTIHLNHFNSASSDYQNTLEDTLKTLRDPITAQQVFKKTHVNGTESRPPFAFFQVGCTEHYCREMIASLKSLAVQYDGKWDAWCVVDETCNEILDQELPFGDMTCNRISIQKISSMGGVPDLFHRCASARLWVPQVLTDYTHLLYLDSDTLITNSIQPVLQAMTNNKKAIFSLVEEVDSASCAGADCGWYNQVGGADAIKAGVNGYNTGVLGINVHLWNEGGTIDKILRILKEAKDGKVQLPLGDQDILNLIARRESSLLQQFPCEFNVRTDSQCKDNHMPVVLHGNRDCFASGQWKQIYDKMIQQANAMLSEWPKEQRLATSLWEAAEIKSLP